MEFWLSYNNGAEKLRLPVNPSNYEFSRAALNTVANVNNIGNVNMLGKIDLGTLPLVSFFPPRYESYCKYSDFPSPEDCVKLIDKWWASGKPIRIKITGTAVDTPVSIESFVWGERDGSGRIYYTLDLKEYKFLTAKTESTNVSKRQSKPPVKTYVVKSGDTLHSIAKKTTGSSANHKKIAAANNIKNGQVKAWQKLVIL